MYALETWSGAGFDRERKTSGTSFHTSGIYIFLITFTSIYYLSNAPLLLGHYDLGWHLAAGDLIRQRGSIPFQDPWAFTLGDREWYNLSWLWDLIASIVVQYAGFSGLTLVTVGCGAVIVAYLASACLSSGASALAACIAVFATCLLYPTFATPPNIYLAASPNTATMVFSVIFYVHCLKKTRRFLLPAMMMLWANLHGGFVLGFFIIGLFGGVALLRRNWMEFRIYGLTGAACLAAILVNPLGLHIYDGVTATLGHFVQGKITEWQPYSRNMTLPGCIPGIIYILVFLALELRYAGSSSVPLETRLLTWLFLVLGFHQFRYMAFFFLFSTVAFARHVDRLLPGKLNIGELQKSFWTAGIVGLCVLPLTFMHVRPALGLSDDLLSEQDAQYLQANLSQARLLNHWNVGGPLIFRTHGTVPIFIDGRAATAYPDSLLRDYFKLVKWDIDENAWDMVIEKYKIDAVLWPKVHDVLRHFLVDERGWKEQYVGSHESLYVKP
ncbi:hypothetical protein [Bradyrhizobium sp.]|uniref:hypothetical protein n=1 Tax=Bradyrhizobium sp. TaxID=376 RepID=UPI0023953C84|nr:hypothetical protein [Bradyrhizobium sp.]MDE1935611.1 hypothetical protein [Bradyrhizobium sp.]